MRLPTFSRVGLAMKCPASCVLPQASTESAAATRGTEGHQVAHDVLKHGRKTVMVPAEWADLEIEALRAHVGEGELHYEPAFSYDASVDNAKHLGDNIGRAYADADVRETFCGAADVLAVREEDAALTDLKTGKTPGDLWQLKVQAVAVSRTFDVSTVRASFAYVQEDGTIRFDSHTFTSMDLADFADELLMLRGRVINAAKASGQQVTVGDHCRYCPAFTSCPAQTRLVKAATNELETLANAPLVPAVAASAWEYLKRVEALCKRLRDNLETYAKQEPFELPSGAIVREAESSREHMDATKAYDALLNAGFPLEKVQEAITLTTSAAKVKDTFNGEHKRAFAVIRDAGGFYDKTTTGVREVKPKRKAG